LQPLGQPPGDETCRGILRRTYDAGGPFRSSADVRSVSPATLRAVAGARRPGPINQHSRQRVIRRANPRRLHTVPIFFSISVPAASRPSFRSLKLKRHMPMSFRPLCLCSVCLFTDFPPGHDRRHEIEPVFLTLLAMRTTTVKSLVAMPSIVMGFCRWPSLIGPATPFGNSQEIFRNSGTDGSNPVPPNGESATNRAPEISQRREDKRSARCKKMDRLS